MRYILFIILIGSIFPIQAEAQEIVTVKLVNYIGETDHLDIQVEGNYSTVDSTLAFQEGVKYHLSVYKNCLYLEGEGEKHKINNSLILIPEIYDKEHRIYVNDRPYLGAMEIKIEDGKIIRPINQLPLEDYLKGVVPFEVYPSWNIETLKAQALAARTYAVSHLNDDMDDTIQYQVYGGYSWDKNTTQAVDETRNEVITYQHQLIDAYYSASNGGMTENNAHVWGGKALTYFPVKEDPYDPTQPWSFSVHRTQIDLNTIHWDNPYWWDEVNEKDEEISSSIKKWLNNNGYPGEIKILEIPKFQLSNQQLNSKRTDRGSIEISFLQKLIDGTILFEHFIFEDVKLKKIRPMISGNQFKSYLIDSLEYKNDVYTMKGKGFGHGVGMSQWGASVMGENGKKYKDILHFYYPGTTITPYSDK